VHGKDWNGQRVDNVTHGQIDDQQIDRRDGTSADDADDRQTVERHGRHEDNAENDQLRNGRQTENERRRVAVIDVDVDAAVHRCCRQRSN
jgi:hypothetical protein